MDGLGPLDIGEVKAPEKVGRTRDGRICVCGHGARNHGATAREYFNAEITDVPAGSVACSVGRHQCKCEQFIAVLETSDNRRFMSRTIGPGADHALARGVNNALNAGAAVRWREGIVCGKCGQSGKLLPVAIRVGPNGAVIARETTEHNYLLCADCREQLIVEPDRNSLANVSAPALWS